MKKLGIIRTILPTQIEIMNLDRLVIMSNYGLEDAEASLDEFEVHKDQGSERLHVNGPDGQRTEISALASDWAKSICLI